MPQRRTMSVRIFSERICAPRSTSAAGAVRIAYSSCWALVGSGTACTRASQVWVAPGLVGVDAAGVESIALGLAMAAVYGSCSRAIHKKAKPGGSVAWSATHCRASFEPALWKQYAEDPTCLPQKRLECS